MDELLKQLLEADILTESTKRDIEKAVNEKMATAIEEARNEARTEVTAQLNQQWISERETLIETLDEKLTEALVAEIEDLKHDIGRFRDLEAEAASKLVESKKAMASQVKKDIAQLIEKMNSFLEVRLASEFEELREDMNIAKKQQFGKKVFEAFADEYKRYYAGSGSVEFKLTETERRLSDATKALEIAEKRNAKLDRAMKMEKVLKPLSGRNREVMEAILKTVDTPMLEEAYKNFVGRVLKETADSYPSEKETSRVLAEGKKSQSRKGVIKRGNDDALLGEQYNVRQRENQNTSTISESDKLRLRKLAGLA